MNNLIKFLIPIFFSHFCWSQTPPNVLGKLVPSAPIIKYSLAQGTYNPSPVDFVITNISAVPIHYKLSFPNRPSWIDTSLNENLLTLEAGQVAGVGVGVNVMKIGPGRYSTNFVVAGDFVNSPLIIPVELNVIKPEKLIVSPMGAGFATDVGGTNPVPLIVHLTNASDRPFKIKLSVSKQQKWLSIDKKELSIILKPENVGNVKLLFDASKLTEAGNYTASVMVTGDFTNSPVQIPVSLTLTPSFKPADVK